ncbi:MAG TPA: SGNH/GDSL hydrolase family protein, partial [Phycisphaerae bacterium]|nr:SGNH/GDSL hydrolase family protein [Phycisphaerae bacterium]
MDIELTNENYARGMVSSGDSTRTAFFIQKLRDSRPITYAAIGGSITGGANASSPELSYVSRFGQWLDSKTHCRTINAGIGATTSMFGAYRAHDDILSASPDIITIEFAVNDTCNPDTAGSFEWLVRQCVDQPQMPLVILIFTMCHDGSNLQNIHIPIGRHYGLPMLSFRDAIYPDIASGQLSWPELSSDDVHPNDDGHRFISEMLIRFLELCDNSSGNLNSDNPVRTLPCPLIKNASRYFYGKVTDAAAMNIISNNGWKQQLHESNRSRYVGW